MKIVANCCNNCSPSTVTAKCSKIVLDKCNVLKSSQRISLLVGAVYSGHFDLVFYFIYFTVNALIEI